MSCDSAVLDFYDMITADSIYSHFTSVFSVSTERPHRAV